MVIVVGYARNAIELAMIAANGTRLNCHFQFVNCHDVNVLPFWEAATKESAMYQNEQ
jgi:hypothetical protein